MAVNVIMILIIHHIPGTIYTSLPGYDIYVTSRVQYIHHFPGTIYTSLPRVRYIRHFQGAIAPSKRYLTANAHYTSPYP